MSYDLVCFKMSINEIVEGFFYVLRDHELVKIFLHMHDSWLNELFYDVLSLDYYLNFSHTYMIICLLIERTGGEGSNMVVSSSNF